MISTLSMTSMCFYAKNGSIWDYPAGARRVSNLTATMCQEHRDQPLSQSLSPRAKEAEAADSRLSDHPRYRPLGDPFSPAFVCEVYYRLPPFLGLITFGREPRAGIGSMKHAEQAASILTEAQISPRPHGFWRSAASAQKAAKTVLVWPQGCVWA